MSMNVYLKVDEVQASEHFSKTQERGASGQTNSTFRIHGQYIFREKGPWYLMWNETEPIPGWLKPFIEEVSIHVAFPFAGRRETGIYQYESAKATLDTRSASKGEREYWVEIRATNLQDALELLRLIRVGGIRPTESFEGPQADRSRVELEERLQYTEREITKLRAEIHQNDEWRKALRSVLQRLIEEVKMSSLLVLRGRIQKRLESIFTAHFQ